MIPDFVSHPLPAAALFMAASLLVMWRLEAMSRRGMAGTALGTLVMPYCSGMGNIMFVFVLAAQKGPGRELLVNCLVNNVTNLTLLLGLPALLWGMTIIPRGKQKLTKKKHQEHQLNRLSLMFTMLVVLFFAGAVWALSRDGEIGRTDGLVLIGLFLFWQSVELFDVLKHNVRQNRRPNPLLLTLDLLLLAIGAYGLYASIEGLTRSLSAIPSGFLSMQYLGWITGWLMVVPNGLLALYYGWRRRADIVYSSQFADGHICVPLCVGLYACLRPIAVPGFLDISLILLAAATLVHLGFILLFGSLPRAVGWTLVIAYAAFVVLGLA